MYKLSTLCYIERDNQYLMLHRTVKKNDVNKDKWIGVGGHFEAQESPEECLLREVWEETGYTLTSYRYRGIVTFIYGEDVTEYMSLYTADGFTGDPIPCDEGELEWVDKEAVLGLNLWEGDKIFFRLLDEEREFFSLKLVYDKTDTLQYAALDGKPLELFDILNPDGSKTGIVKERGVAHREGSLHGTSHIWLVRENEKSGYDVLLQKRSAVKDSYAGYYDISSAGHVAAGDDYLESALRELKEELGIQAAADELHYVGKRQAELEEVFYGRLFKDSELCTIYVYREPIEISEMQLQPEEVEEVLWMDYKECMQGIQNRTLKHCIYVEEFEMLGEYLGISIKSDSDSIF
ncbi:NUDIX domain-containing protein [Faecalicatena sp. AGMB00832]|uniref:NUDIX domain-containing protein n=1 Tax=Faecalicatena faecalis TaxID=2726362 RepID=A0ABS6CYU9_9FIRM|nr:NUDIX domain-containing protein [Faecalicatena faecalis]MBU3874494.1 NUDIX domain-containing protein [Faecalicatena faecalis]